MRLYDIAMSVERSNGKKGGDRACVMTGPPGMFSRTYASSCRGGELKSTRKDYYEIVRDSDKIVTV